MPRKQSREDQLKRIERCLCPVHGACLTQIPFLFNCADFSVGECTRGDCHIKAIVDYVFEGETVNKRIRHLITSEQMRRLEHLWDMDYASVEEARRKIDAELETIANSPEVQLPICD
jgi:hypothetical protein